MRAQLRHAARIIAAMTLALPGPGSTAIAGAAPSVQSQGQRDQMRQVVNAFGRCIVKRAAREASQFVLAPTVRGGRVKPDMSLVDPECLPSFPGLEVGGFASNAQYLTYAFADALVRSRLASFDGDLNLVPLTQFEKIHLVSVTVQPKSNESAADLAKEQAVAAAMMNGTTMDLFGYCVVRADSKGAHALLMTEVTGPAERTAFGALQPVMDNCLTEGQHINSDMTSLRGIIALAFYRLAIAANPQLAPGAKAPK